MHPLAKWLKDNGVKKKAFAPRIGTSPATVTRICQGGVPETDVVFAIDEQTGGEVDPNAIYRNAKRSSKAEAPA